MAKAKRKTKTKQPRKAGKKVKSIKVLKKKTAHPAPKVRARAKKPVKSKAARPLPKKVLKGAAQAKPLIKAPAGAKADD
jgi:hypothetical protein